MKPRWLIPALLALAGAAAAQEQKKQPPPEFSGGYLPPVPTAPAPRADIFAVIDVAALLLALSLAAWFVLYRRSRRGLRVVLLFSLLYFGFYRHGCVCAIGAIQNVSLAIFHPGYALPFAAGAFFLLPLLFALFVGRVFCAGVCPLGAIQDLVLLRPRRIPAPLENALGVIPYLYLGTAVLFAATGALFVICDYDPFIAFFRLGGSTGMLAFGAGMLLLATVVGRPYCRFLCPYGVLLRWLSPLGKRRVTITPSRCIQCHLCADSCPFGAIRPPAPEMGLEERTALRRRLGRLTLSLPLIVGFMALLGYLASPAMARLDHNVALADRIWREERGETSGPSDASIAFRNRGEPLEALFARAQVSRRRFALGGALLGAWFGLVIGLRLIAVSLRRRSPDYEADPAACLSCARCYAACPIEQERIQLLPPDAWRSRVEA